MTLQQQIGEDLKTALKAGQEQEVGVLRFLNSVIHNKEIEKYREKKTHKLTDEEVLNVLLAEAKKRKEAILLFEKGGRKDLVDKEKSELSIIEKYLPKQLNKEEVEKIIDGILKRSKAKDFGSAMKEAMKELKGKADAAMISAIIKERLG
jgi:uncharacterized protein YqeY